MKTSKVIALILCFALNSLLAQDNLKIGEWRSHLPYQVAQYITQDDTKLYFTTESSLYTISKEDEQTDFFSKVDGLSDVGSNIIKYDKFNDVLLLVYDNSNLDVISDEAITNLPFILTSQVVGDKQVYDVYVDSDTTTYLAMGFGLKVLNVRNLEFGDEVKAEIKFNSVTVFNNQIYAATDEGIYRIEKGSTANIQDFSEWELLGSAEGFPDDYYSKNMVVYQGKLYTDVNDVLMRYDETTLDSIYQEDNLRVSFLTAEGQRLIVGMRCCIPDADCSCDAFCNSNCFGKVLFMDGNGEYTLSGDDCVNLPQYALEDEKGQIWFGDDWRGLRKATSYDVGCSSTVYNSPLTQAVSDITIVNNKVLVATQLSTRDPKFVGDGYFQLADGNWTNYNASFGGALKDLVAFATIAINPTNNNVYIGTLWDGLIEMIDGVPKTRYNEDLGNSTLQHAIGDAARVRVTGLAFDEDENLWIANNATSRPISVLKNDGEWLNDFKDISEGELRFLVIDGFGYKWFTVDGSAQSLLVYDDAGTLDDKNDDRIRFINANNSVLPSNRIFSIVADLDGDVWVGTNEGIVIFECGGNVFDTSCQGSRRVVDIGGFNTNLLESQEIHALAIDGANRKWVGTNNGVFVLSADGRNQEAFFDKTNSPLFDNRITAIDVNNQTGEVFIGTAEGIISYRSEAIEGGKVNSKNAYAYPNPVRPGYEGPIAIKGLARDANIKITDVNGQLVYETKSLGGQAIWDGRDYNGRKVNSGVYLVFSTNTQNLENPDAIVTKILVIN